MVTATADKIQAEYYVYENTLKFPQTVTYYSYMNRKVPIYLQILILTQHIFVCFIFYPLMNGLNTGSAFIKFEFSMIEKREKRGKSL